MKNIFRGLGIALITPFRADKSVDYKSLEILVDRQLSQGADFLCILGTTAETPCLTSGEKQAIKAFIVKQVNGRVPILMGCGGNNTAAVVEELQAWDLSGIDGILSVCPYYNRPSQEGIYQHFKAVAAATTLPVVVYNIPGRTGVNIQAKTLVRLAHDVENIVAVKEASGNIQQIQDILRDKPDDFEVLSGDDGISYEVIAMGGVGIISVIGNALTDSFAKMVHLACAGQYAEARPLHQAFGELYKLLFVDGNPAGVKSLLSTLGLIENELRLPLVPVSQATKEHIAEWLNK